MNKEQLSNTMGRTETPDIDFTDADMAFSPKARRQEQDKADGQREWAEYLKGRDYVDSENNIHNAKTGEFVSQDNRTGALDHIPTSDEDLQHLELSDDPELLKTVNFMQLVKAGRDMAQLNDKAGLDEIKTAIRQKLEYQAIDEDWGKDVDAKVAKKLADYEAMINTTPRSGDNSKNRPPGKNELGGDDNEKQKVAIEAMQNAIDAAIAAGASPEAIEMMQKALESVRNQVTPPTKSLEQGPSIDGPEQVNPEFWKAWKEYAEANQVSELATELQEEAFKQFTSEWKDAGNDSGDTPVPVDGAEQGPSIDSPEQTDPEFWAAWQQYYEDEKAAGNLDGATKEDRNRLQEGAFALFSEKWRQDKENEERERLKLIEQKYIKARENYAKLSARERSKHFSRKASKEELDLARRYWMKATTAYRDEYVNGLDVDDLSDEERESYLDAERRRTNQLAANDLYSRTTEAEMALAPEEGGRIKARVTALMAGVAGFAIGAVGRWSLVTKGGLDWHTASVVSDSVAGAAGAGIGVGSGIHNRKYRRVASDKEASDEAGRNVTVAEQDGALAEKKFGETSDKSLYAAANILEKGTENAQVDQRKRTLGHAALGLLAGVFGSRIADASRGLQGEQGDRGYRGFPGEDGVDGIDGTDGVDGRDAIRPQPPRAGV